MPLLPSPSLQLTTKQPLPPLPHRSKLARRWSAPPHRLCKHRAPCQQRPPPRLPTYAALTRGSSSAWARGRKKTGTADSQLARLNDSCFLRLSRQTRPALMHQHQGPLRVKCFRRLCPVLTQPQPSTTPNHPTTHPPHA